MVVEHRAFGQRDRGSKPSPPFQSLGNIVYPTLHVFFRRDSKNHWSLLSGVYARESKSPTQVNGKIQTHGARDIIL